MCAQTVDHRYGRDSSVRRPQPSGTPAHTQPAHRPYPVVRSWCRVESAIGMIYSAWPDAGTQPARAADPDIADEISHTGSSRVIVDRLLRPITASDASLEKNTRRAAVWATCGAPLCATCVAHTGRSVTLAAANVCRCFPVNSGRRPPVGICAW